MEQSSRTLTRKWKGGAIIKHKSRQLLAYGERCCSASYQKSCACILTIVGTSHTLWEVAGCSKFPSFHHSGLSRRLSKILKVLLFSTQLFLPFVQAYAHYSIITLLRHCQKDSEQCFQDIVLITLYFTMSENPWEDPHKGITLPIHPIP